MSILIQTFFRFVKIFMMNQLHDFLRISFYIQISDLYILSIKSTVKWTKFAVGDEFSAERTLEPKLPGNPLNEWAQQIGREIGIESDWVLSSTGELFKQRSFAHCISMCFRLPLKNITKNIGARKTVAPQITKRISVFLEKYSVLITFEYV